MYGYIPAERFPKYKQKYLSHIKFHYDLSNVSSNTELISGTLSDDGTTMSFAQNGISNSESIKNEKDNTKLSKENNT